MSSTQPHSLDLNERDQNVVDVFEFDSELTIKEIVEATEHSEREVQSAASKLAEKGVLDRRPMLGDARYTVYSLSSEREVQQ